MLQPMGLPENVRVIAWGLSLERPTMIKYGIKSIRGILLAVRTGNRYSRTK
jgi:phenylalanyl-tRNA synthetase alpha chain